MIKILIDRQKQYAILKLFLVRKLCFKVEISIATKFTLKIFLFILSWP